MTSPAETTATDLPPVAALWASYRAEVLPPDAPRVQVEGCRAAFYAGACALLSGLLDSIDEGDEPSVRDLANMARIADELRRFAHGDAPRRH